MTVGRIPTAVAALLLWLGGSNVGLFPHVAGFSTMVSPRHHQGSRMPFVAFEPTRSMTTTTALSMGAFEDFLSNQDASQRSKENQQYLKTLASRVDRINELEAEVEEMEDEELEAKTQEFRERLAAGEDINGPLLEEAFAVVREAAWRVLELRHYDVQILGGLVLNDGRLAEMATGEGKTLVATLPSYVNALMGKSLVVTVNDYLARRDMEKMGQVHRFLGLTVGLVQSTGMTAEQRRQAYACDVVYVTNSELGFDYLRDHLALSPEQTVLPSSTADNNNGDYFFDNCFCIVDEADSVLIDEARTPLIISKQVPAPAQKYAIAHQLAGALKKDIHYTVDLKNKNVVLTEQGYRESEKALGIDSLFELLADGNGQEKSAWAPYVNNAVKAKELFSRDVEYTVLQDPKTGASTGVGIIDAFTGRVLDGRRWSDGLHQSIEAAEGLVVSEQSQVIAKVTYQSLFFGQFRRLAGMTGTATADAGELEQTYGLKVTPIPTALPVARRDYPDVAFKTRHAANQALVRQVAAVLDDGGNRPCLIGTTSVAQSEQIVQLLRDNDIHAELLNASPKNAPRESEIIAQAGRAGVVTVATNMAGRGTDILLGGCATTMARIQTRRVLLDECHLLSEAERATLPPSPPDDYFPCDVPDDVRDLLKDAASAIRQAWGPDNDKLTGLQVDELLTVAFDTTEADDDAEHVVLLREAAQAVKAVYAPALAKEKEAVQAAGGLYVLGTNRHESSRIDVQLRGRAGRQGDAGSSRFFLSFEDDMFVIFGGDGLSKMLQMFRVSDDMPVEAPQVTQALDKVQAAVEEKYRDIRREVSNFDQVLNGQRQAIYRQRRNILNMTPEASLDLMKQYNEATIDDIVKGQTTDNVVDAAKLAQKVHQFFPPLAPLVRESDLAGLDPTAAAAVLKVAVDEVFGSKAAQMANLGRSSNYITLVTLDNAWSSHLQAMENLKEAVVLRQYQGRDPLSEYTNEAFVLFQGLEDSMRFNAVFSLWQSFVQPVPAAAAA